MRFSFTKPRSATVPELEEQLASAKAAHTKALQAVETAQAAFDDNGADSAEQALEKAQTGAQSAARHVERAQRLLDDAKAREAEEKRRQLEARERELEKQIDELNGAAAAALAEEEARAWVAVAEKRNARREHAIKISRVTGELARVRTQLGRELGDFGRFVDSVEPNRPLVAARVRALAAGMPTDSAMRRYAFEIAADLERVR